MVRVTGPCYSISASGTIADAITYASWKGVAYAREWFTPQNPKSAAQIVVRAVLAMAVVEWSTDVVTAPQKAAYEVGAAGTGMSGFNLWMKRAIDEWFIQFLITDTPATVSVADNYPSDVITWTKVV